MGVLHNPVFWVIAVSVAAAMEFWAWWLHKVLWHGALWGSHRTHHTPHDGLFELNDVHGLLHALFAAVLLYTGLSSEPGAYQTVAVGVGVGMTTFGVGYWLVHDGFIHGRLPLQFLSRVRYFRRLRAAHRAHHLGDHIGPYGLFLGHWELTRARR